MMANPELFGISSTKWEEISVTSANRGPSLLSIESSGTGVKVGLMAEFFFAERNSFLFLYE